MCKTSFFPTEALGFPTAVLKDEKVKLLMFDKSPMAHSVPSGLDPFVTVVSEVALYISPSLPLVMATLGVIWS